MVTQLKCAVLDPNWRRDWLAGKNPGTHSFGPSGSNKVHGTRFHQETERLAKWLTDPSNLINTATIRSADELLDFAWLSSLQNFTDELFAQNKGEEAAAFVARMRSFCERLIELKRRTKKFENWQDVFIAAEESIKNIHVPVGSTTVEIAAKVDAIRFHPKHHLEVVDYKLSQGAQQKSDLIQLAIYAHLLPLWRKGCEFCGTLEYYFPDFMAVNVSRQDLADIYAGLVAPVLLEMFAPRSMSQEERVVAAFKAFNLDVETGGIVQGPQIIRIKLQPAAGVKVVSLVNRAEDLQIRLSLSEPPLITAQKGFVAVDLPRTDRETIQLLGALDAGLMKDSKSPLAFPVGVGIDGEAIRSDFLDSNTCHILVAGTSGSGKSEWLKTLVASLIHRNPPDRLQLVLVDPKILTFSNAEKSPYLWRPVANDIGAALAVLRDAVDEMDKRYETLAKEGFVSLGDRYRAGLGDLPFLVLIFDEFADLILSGREEKREFENLISRIAGKGRAAGIHLVLATQRPDRTVVTELIKANLPMKVCLRVASATNSQIILDAPGGESLLGKGDLICDLGKGQTRAQSYFISQEDFLRLLKS